MTTLETYFRSLAEIRNTGSATQETSFYGPLETLLNDIGQQLKPKVRCVMQLKQQGAGMPDGGLFSAKQFQRESGELKNPENPERGVIEVKSTGEEVVSITQTQQVSKYWQRYGQVLVTNYRDFVLVGRDFQGQPVTLEAFSLADSEQAFWEKVQNSREFAAEQEEQFSEYLKRVMLQQAVIASPQDLACLLASYAKDAQARIEKTDLPNLAQVREALEEALGVGFQDQKGKHFFKSTLIQTLFYGIFSAWVLWHRQGEQGRFEWKTAVWYMHVPMIQALFSKVATPWNLGRLDLVEVLDWAGDALNRVDREAFFSKFDEGQAVQYFYEPFLQAFDPTLRKELGVWYTPPEIVQYMVARVDTVLREELHIADGLADENVYILDPCCGTGAYLVEVLRKIDETLKANGADALGGSDLKRAAMERVFGFEILTAPFVVAHLQLGLLLQNLGVPLVDEQERVGVFLTNALTGWEPPDDEAKERFRQIGINYPELEKEREEADEVKRGKEILVVLGNPPYNAFAGLSQREEISVDEYKEGLIDVWGIKKFNLDDLYVRFFRLAEHCVAERRPIRGIVCYISNFSYLADPSYVVMRQSILSNFDSFWIDCMNGDSRETGKRTPTGDPDPSVFSTKFNRAGIKLGTSINLAVRKNVREYLPQVRFRHFWGKNKRNDLSASLEDDNFDDFYDFANPQDWNRFSLRPVNISKEYLRWPEVADLCVREPLNGPIERRGNSLIVFEHEKNELYVLDRYLDESCSDNEIRSLAPSLMKPSGEFKAKKVRNNLKGKYDFDDGNICRYPFKPFDIRLAYLDANIQPLFSRPSPELLSQRFDKNKFLIVRESGVTDPTSPPFYFSSLVCDYHSMVVEAKHIPILVRPEFIERGISRQISIFETEDFLDLTPKANLSDEVLAYLSQLNIEEPNESFEVSSLIWMHVLAIGYSPDYRNINSDGLRYSWPRIPLPSTKEVLVCSANLGRQIATFLDTEISVPGITSGTPTDPFKGIANITRVGGGQLNPDTDLALTAKWGHAGSGSSTMPGKGRIVTRPYTDTEPHNDLLGSDTRDIYLNDIAYWQNIPARVWDYTIGGYQVIKKWLSYREEPLLGRPLKPDEVREVTNMARRIAAILLLEPELNANYEAVKANTYNWSQDDP